MATDWVQDETLSAEETMAKFEALKPEPTAGPLQRGYAVTTDAPPWTVQGVRRLEDGRIQIDLLEVGSRPSR